MRRAIESKHDVMERIFDAQAIVSLLSCVYLGENSDGLDEVTIGRTLREAEEILERTNDFIDRNMEMKS
jgi:hypothetical protein